MVNILVLGMHRAGTSAITRVLRAGGFACGDEEGLVGPRPENPAGFLERRDFVGLNDRLLASLGWTWDGPAAEPLRPPPARAALVHEARTLVARDLAPWSPWVLKDPRISLLLPWWRQVLLDRFIAVVPVRPPAEVAWSLWVRDGLPLPLGGALWAAYHRHLAAGLEGLPVITVGYPALTTDPGGVVGEIFAALRRLGIEPPPAAGETEAAAAIEPILRRATQPAGAGIATEGSATAMAEAWGTAPVRVHDRFHLPIPDPLAWEAALLEEHRRLRDHQRSAERAGRQLAREREDHERTREELGRTRDALRAERERTDHRPITVPSAGEPPPPAAVPPERPATPAGPGASEPRVTGRAGLRLVLRRAVGRAIGRARLRVGLPNPLFDGAWYRATYPDVRRARLGAWWHWRRHGWREGRDPNPWFSVRWYLATNPDVRREGIDPLRHYLAHGWREGRDPGPRFDGRAYRERYPDVAAAGIDPLLHFLRFGAGEGRIATPLASRTAGRG